MKGRFQKEQPCLVEMTIPESPSPNSVPYDLPGGGRHLALEGVGIRELHGVSRIAGL
jgi:hypothetical protein